MRGVISVLSNPNLINYRLGLRIAAAKLPVIFLLPIHTSIRGIIFPIIRGQTVATESSKR